MSADAEDLAKASLFSGFERGDLIILAEIANSTVLPQDIVVANEGAPNRALYYVRSGRVRVTRELDGRDVELATIGAGQTFGEMSLLGDGRTSATVTTAALTELLVIDGAELEGLFEVHPPLGAKFWRRIAVELKNRLAEANDSIVAYSDMNRSLVENPKLRDFYASCFK